MLWGFAALGQCWEESQRPGQSAECCRVCVLQRGGCAHPCLPPASQLQFANTAQSYRHKLQPMTLSR